MGITSSIPPSNYCEPYMYSICWELSQGEHWVQLTRNPPPFWNPDWLHVLIFFKHSSGSSLPLLFGLPPSTSPSTASGYPQSCKSQTGTYSSTCIGTTPRLVFWKGSFCHSGSLRKYQKILYLITDAVLNIMFIRIIQRRLVAVGVSYWPTFWSLIDTDA